jgi:hypothetical protein
VQSTGLATEYFDQAQKTHITLEREKMKRQWFIISLMLVLSLLVAACGGGGSKAPVDMEQEETSAFDIERPKDWNTNSMDLFGVTVLIASSADIAAETVFESGDFTEAFQDTPGVIIMTVPQAMAEEGGDFGFSAEEIKNLPTGEEDVEIVRQGDVTIDGVKGYELVGKGQIEDFGSGEVGVHLAVLERDSGPLAFIAFSPAGDMDENLDIFKYMFESIKFK